MTSARATVAALAVEVGRREVLRSLGYPRARPPSPTVVEALDRLWGLAAQLVAPRGTYRVSSAEEARVTGMPDPTPLVGLGLCTIGAALEAEERTRSDGGQLLEALILDAFGSAAAEAAAEALNVLVCVEAQKRGYQLPPRVSPGYGRWEIRGQAELLRLLDAGEIGVRLTEGMMMVPRKSVSFGVRFETAAHRPTRTAHRRCAGCDLAGCAYRIANGDER